MPDMSCENSHVLLLSPPSLSDLGVTQRWFALGSINQLLTYLFTHIKLIAINGLLVCLVMLPHVL